MGINIYIVRNAHKVIDNYRIFDYPKQESIPWDNLRYSGDRDVMFGLEDEGVKDKIEYEHISEAIEEHPYTHYDSYRRPKDFNQAREWINKYIDNKKRWLDIFDIMEKDKDLWFGISY